MLSDPTKRRLHDSTDIPDVPFPSELKPGADFYSAFGPAFDSLSRFSERHPVPSLGDAASPSAAVDGFYDFWFLFKSWREFAHDDEEDPEVAECREHKREIERKNVKLREKAKKEETNKIKALVQTAYDSDPRVRAAAAAAKAAKEAKKLEKGAAARAAKEAADAEAAAAAAAAEAAAAAAADQRGDAKKQKEAARKALQRERKRLRTAAEPAIASNRLASGLADVETLCSDLPVEAITSLAAAVEAAAPSVAAQVEELVAALEKLSPGYRAKAEKAAAKAGGGGGGAAAAAAAPSTPATAAAAAGGGSKAAAPAAAAPAGAPSGAAAAKQPQPAKGKQPAAPLTAAETKAR